MLKGKRLKEAVHKGVGGKGIPSKRMKVAHHHPHHHPHKHHHHHHAHNEPTTTILSDDANDDTDDGNDDDYDDDDELVGMGAQTVSKICDDDGCDDDGHVDNADDKYDDMKMRIMIR